MIFKTFVGVCFSVHFLTIRNAGKKTNNLYNEFIGQQTYYKRLENLCVI